MLMSETLKNLILKAFDARTIKSQFVKEDMITFQQDANNKALAGIPSMDEAFRVTHGSRQRPSVGPSLQTAPGK